MAGSDHGDSETEALQSLLVELGTRYETAGDAARALSVLRQADDSLEHDAVSIWCSIVETESPVRDRSAAESDEYNERRAGATRALATLARKSPATAPLDVFLKRTTDADPLVRVYASYALEAVARREPSRVRPHVDRLVSTATPDPNPLGADVWGAPQRSTSDSHVDRLVGAKLFRAALESVLRTETPASERWDVLTAVGGRLAGETYDVRDVLAQLLPAGHEFWPDYLACLEQYAGRADPSGIGSYCAGAVCLRLAATCEDRHNGILDWSGGENRVDERALEQLERALEIVSEPDLSRRLGRGARDLLRRYAADRFAGEAATFNVEGRTVHRRLEGTAPIQPSADVRATLERILVSVREPHPDRTTDAGSLYEWGTTALVAEIAMVDPSLVRDDVGWLENVLAATPVTENRENGTVLETCCRALLHVGSVFPEEVASTAPTVQDSLHTVIGQSRFDLLDDVLGAMVVTAERQPTLLDPFVEALREWCVESPGEDDSADFSVDRRSIRYYAVRGLRFDSTAGTRRALDAVQNDPDASERLRATAEAVADRL